LPGVHHAHDESFGVVRILEPVHGYDVRRELIGLMALLLSSIGYALGLALKSEDALAPMLSTLIQPIMLLSGILLPLYLSPAWLQRVADFNPSPGR
jgi:ABC-type uncharacterized transport system permease subunit